MHTHRLRWLRTDVHLDCFAFASPSANLRNSSDSYGVHGEFARNFRTQGVKVDLPGDFVVLILPVPGQSPFIKKSVSVIAVPPSSSSWAMVLRSVSGGLLTSPTADRPSTDRRIWPVALMKMLRSPKGGDHRLTEMITACGCLPLREAPKGDVYGKIPAATADWWIPSG
jgi:hypothetical protein